MSTNRREFIGRAAGSVLLGAVGFSSRELLSQPAGQATAAAGDWDLTWVMKVTGPHKVVSDVPAIESGAGVARAAMWVQQYVDVLGVSPRDATSVLVVRHEAIVLAMQQKFWDDYGIGKSKKVTHPMSGKATDRNPALLSSKRPGDGIPEMFDAFALDKIIERGGIVLGCGVAFQGEIVETIAKKDKIPDDAAHKKALSLLVPGVVLQPSGVFAVIRAQEAGCAYVRAS